MFTEQELIEHYRLRTGIPENQKKRAVSEYRAMVRADPEYAGWLAGDLENAMEVTRMIVAILEATQNEGDQINTSKSGTLSKVASPSTVEFLRMQSRKNNP